MADDTTSLQLVIKGFTPDSIPMGRLAEYLAAFADLVGHQEAVRFHGARKGSLLLRAQIPPPLFDPVVVRLANSALQDSGDDVRKAYKKIDDLLYEDRTEGSVRYSSRAAAPLVTFPGVKRARPRPLSVKQHGTVDGKIIRMGGKDSSVPIHVIDDRGDEIKCSARLELARELRRYLLEDEWLRFHGEGVWRRDEQGSWSVESFRIQSHEVLDQAPLPEIVARLRQQKTGWSDESDPVEAAERLRHGNDYANRV